MARIVNSHGRVQWYETSIFKDECNGTNRLLADFLGFW